MGSVRVPQVSVVHCGCWERSRVISLQGQSCEQCSAVSMADRPLFGGGARLKLHLVWQQVQGWRQLLFGCQPPVRGAGQRGSRTQGTAAPADLDFT